MRVLHSFYVKINKEKKSRSGGGGRNKSSPKKKKKKQKTGEKKIGKGAGRKQSCKKKLSPL
jgi:hypothetical protein